MEIKLPQHIFWPWNLGQAVCIYNFSSSCEVGIIPIYGGKPKEGHTVHIRAQIQQVLLAPRLEFVTLIWVYFTLVKMCLLKQIVETTEFKKILMKAKCGERSRE